MLDKLEGMSTLRDLYDLTEVQKEYIDSNTNSINIYNNHETIK